MTTICWWQFTSILPAASYQNTPQFYSSTCYSQAVMESFLDTQIKLRNYTSVPLNPDLAVLLYLIIQYIPIFQSNLPNGNDRFKSHTVFTLKNIYVAISADFLKIKLPYLDFSKSFQSIIQIADISIYI